MKGEKCEPLTEEEIQWLREFREGMRGEAPAEPLDAHEVRWFRSFKLHTESVGVGDESFDWIDLNVAGGGLYQVYKEKIQESKKRIEANIARAKRVLADKATQSDGKEEDS